MKRIKLNDLLIRVLLFINIISSIGVPCLGNYIDKISIYYFIVSIISFILIMLLHGRIIIKGFIKYIFFYYFLLFIPTLFSHGDIYLLICEMGITISTMFIWGSFLKDDFKKYLPTLSFALEVLTYLNFIIILFLPEGLYNIGYIRKYFLFGHVNIAFRYLLPGSCFNLIRSYLYKDKMDNRCKIYLGVVVLTLLLTKPVTAIMGMLVFLLCLFFTMKFKKSGEILSPINSLVASGIISGMLMTVQIPKLFDFIFNRVFSKGSTLSGRLDIWSTALSHIKDRLFYGYGRLTTSMRTLYFNATSAHNQFLIFLFEGGILLMSLIIIIFIVISKKIKQCNHQKIKAVLISTIVSYSFMWIAEPFSYSGTLLMFMIWMIAYNSGKLFNIE